MCFFRCGEREQDDTLEVLDRRPAGSVCKHPRKVLHAVTSLTRGTRKSLFVVDESNGLGEGGVICVSHHDVTLFLEVRRAGLEEPSVVRAGTPAVLQYLRDLAKGQAP